MNFTDDGYIFLGHADALWYVSYRGEIYGPYGSKEHAKRVLENLRRGDG